MRIHPTWGRCLVSVSDSEELCAPFGRRTCSGIVVYVLTYWSAQGRKRTPAASRRPLCAEHARRYIERHHGEVTVAAFPPQRGPQPVSRSHVT